MVTLFEFYQDPWRQKTRVPGRRRLRNPTFSHWWNTGFDRLTQGLAATALAERRAVKTVLQIRILLLNVYRLMHYNIF